jgi:hypothetical protein
MWHHKTRSSQLSSMCKSWSASPPQVVAMLGSRFSVLDLAQMHNLCIHELVGGVRLDLRTGPMPMCGGSTEKRDSRRWLKRS